MPPRPNKSGTANITPRAKNESAETDQKSIIRIRTGKTNVSPVMSRTIAPSKENTPRGVNKPPKYKETVKEINLYSKFQSHNTHEVDGEEVEEDIITESLEMDKADGNSVTKTPNKVPMSFNGKSETETNEMPKPFYFDKGMWEALQHREFSPALGKDQENPDQKSEELKELAYDGVLKCFYSPATQEYYNVRY